MSYQALARKWRPKTFSEMVGQQYVLQGLIHAIDMGRVHHAYFFTGTRGVGKTTLSRLVAKCLNCETGITAQPCCQCQSCQEIDQGRFIDLIEIDAASRTKVEDTRELLDNVQYAPTRGRFKIYLIDEVHMLSTHSFNALLKTLEEPPEHVKFILATTNPRKLPATVLSRCLQFHLRLLTCDEIQGHLQHILEAEKIPFDVPALTLLARAADGSMRDGLSLLDQAIAFGKGHVSTAQTVNMLGSIDQQWLTDIVNALIAQDATALFNTVSQIHAMGDCHHEILRVLARLLHVIAMRQQLTSYQSDEFEPSQIATWAQQLAPEVVQVLYQITITSLRDLALAPDVTVGFEMALLRLLAFRPLTVNTTHDDTVPVSAETLPSATPISASPHSKVSHKLPSKSLSNNTPSQISNKTVERTSAVVLEKASAVVLEKAPAVVLEKAPAVVLEKASAVVLEKAPAAKTSAAILARTASRASTARQKKTDAPVATSPSALLESKNWEEMIKKLPLTGIVKQFATNASLVSLSDNIMTLQITNQHTTIAEKLKKQLQSVINQTFNTNITVRFNIGKHKEATPAEKQQRELATRQSNAAESIWQDSNIKFLQTKFSAIIESDSIEPIKQ